MEQTEVQEVTRKSVTLKGKDVLSKLSVNGEPLQYKTGPQKDKNYYIARFNGANFTITEPVYQAWSEGKIAEMTVSENVYKVEDVNNPGEFETRTGWAYDGHISYDQLGNVVKADAKIKVIENEAMKDIRISDTKLAKLLEAEGNLSEK